MSPKQPRNGRRLSNVVPGQGFQSSNSTANKFLGGMRRAWMSGVTPSGKASAPERSLDNIRNEPLAAPGGPVQAPPSTSTAPVPVQLPSTAPSAVQSDPRIITTDITPVSPVTPGEKYTKQHLISIKHSPHDFYLADPPQASAGDAGQVSILPSPEPSNGSRTSPATIVDADRGDARAADPAALQSRLGWAQSAVATHGTRVENSAIRTGTSQESIPVAGSIRSQRTATRSPDPTMHRDKRPRLGISHSVSVSAAPLASPTVLSNRQAGGPNSPTQSPDNIFWSCSMDGLTQLLETSSGSSALSESVELPRVRLLQDACRSEDLFYVTLHQMFCLHTFSPSEFVKLVGFGIDQRLGLEIIKQLLIDNRRLSGDFLKWCVNFPFPVSHMLKNEKYRNMVQQVMQSLTLISQHWSSFEQELRRRSYPPLIDELVVQFRVTSSVLQSIIFTAICRRLIQTKDDSFLKKFLFLFERNQQNYRRRFADPQNPVATEQMQKENEDLIRAYRSLCSQHVPGPSSPATEEQRVTTQMPPQPAHQIAVPALSRVTNNSRQQFQPTFTQNFASQPGHHSYLHHHAAAHLTPLSGTSSIPGNGQRLTSGAPGSPLQILPPGYQALQNPSPIQLRPPGPVSHLGGQQNSVGPLRFNHYVPPPYGTTALQMPSQMTQAGRRGRPRRVDIGQASALAPMGVGPSQGVNESGQFITPELAARMTRREPLMTLVPPQPQGPVDRLLLPALDAIPIAHPHPNPLRVALHQLHLRSPTRRLIRQGAEGEEEAELFQYLRSFAVLPASLGQDEIIFEWRFGLSSDVFGRLPRDAGLGGGQRATRVLSDGNRVYRLRCIKVANASESINESSWATAESVWPSVFYLHVNGKELFVRRKMHNGKDLPLDITANLKEGTNEVTLHFLRSPAESDNLLYALAVEILEIADLERIKRLVRTLPASESRSQIQKRLSLNMTDDDLAIVDDHITIDLVDPFMARIFDVPVRGITCRHQECFDLDSFLSTLAAKSGNGPMKDDWKCPICGEDCRPQSLVIDEFLVNVRAELRRTDRLEGAKAILVKADGSWEPKVEHQSVQAEGSKVSAKRKWSDFEAQTGNTKSKTEGDGDSVLRLSQVPEVIELD